MRCDTMKLALHASSGAYREADAGRGEAAAVAATRVRPIPATTTNAEIESHFG